MGDMKWFSFDWILPKTSVSCDNRYSFLYFLFFQTLLLFAFFVIVECQPHCTLPGDHKCMFSFKTYSLNGVLFQQRNVLKLHSEK